MMISIMHTGEDHLHGARLADGLGQALGASACREEEEEARERDEREEEEARARVREEEARARER